MLDAEGNLYITVCGTKEEGSEAHGKLLMIKGLDDPVAKKEEAKEEDKKEEDKLRFDSAG